MVSPQEEYSRPKWSFWHAVFILAALFVLALPSALIVKFFIRVFLQNLAMILLVILVIRMSGAAISELGLQKRKLGVNIATGLGAGIALFLLVGVLSLFIQYVTGRVPEPQQVVKHLAGLKTPWQLIWPGFVVVVAGPLSEELYFRGMVYPLCRARFGVDVGVLLSALFFGAMHFDLFGLAPIAIAGAGLAYLYQRTGSLTASIMAHGTWNLLTLLVMYFS